MPTRENVWFKCKGCGQPAAFFGAGLPPWYPPGSVGHSKPVTAIRHSQGEQMASEQASRVSCALYRQSSAEEFWALHVDAEPIAPPDGFTPVLA